MKTVCPLSGLVSSNNLFLTSELPAIYQPHPIFALPVHKLRLITASNVKTQSLSEPELSLLTLAWVNKIPLIKQEMVLDVNRFPMDAVYKLLDKLPKFHDILNSLGILNNLALNDRVSSTYLLPFYRISPNRLETLSVESILYGLNEYLNECFTLIRDTNEKKSQIAKARDTAAKHDLIIESIINASYKTPKDRASLIKRFIKRLLDQETDRALTKTITNHVTGKPTTRAQYWLDIITATPKQCANIPMETRRDPTNPKVTEDVSEVSALEAYLQDKLEVGSPIQHIISKHIRAIKQEIEAFNSLWSDILDIHNDEILSITTLDTPDIIEAELSEETAELNTNARITKQLNALLINEPKLAPQSSFKGFGLYLAAKAEHTIKHAAWKREIDNLQSLLRK